MEAVENVVTLKPTNRKTGKSDSTEKSYREANAAEIDTVKSPRETLSSPVSDQYELESTLFVDLFANEKGKKAAISVIKSDGGRRTIVTAITTNGLDKTKAISGITAVMRQYQSGEVIRMRQMCEDAAASTNGYLSRDFIERSVVPMLVDLGIIIRSGERSAYWQAHHLIGKKTNLIDQCKRLFELTPAQRELKQLADQLYAEQQKLNALNKREITMQQQKQAYMRIATQSQQLAELAAQNPIHPTLWDKAKANPGATMILGTLIAGVMMTAINTSPPIDTPMPTVSAAMQNPSPQPDTAAVSAIETAKINQKMKGAR